MISDKYEKANRDITMCWLHFDNMFLYIDSTFIGHKIDLPLLSNTSMFKNI